MWSFSWGKKQYYNEGRKRLTKILMFIFNCCKKKSFQVSLFSSLVKIPTLHFSCHIWSANTIWRIFPSRIELLLLALNDLVHNKQGLELNQSIIVYTWNLKKIHMPQEIICGFLSCSPTVTCFVYHSWAAACKYHFCSILIVSPSVYLGLMYVSIVENHLVRSLLLVSRVYGFRSGA